MGTYATQRDAGSGVFRVRLVVSGWPEVFVSDRSLARTESDGRVRLPGLDPVPLRIEARGDLARGGLRDGEQKVRVYDDDSHAVTASLGVLSTSKTWLVTALTKTATTASVASTAGFASSGVIHLHTEAIAYSGKTATSFTGLTRGYWDTTAQRHEGPDGDRQAGSAITERPVGLQGRYVRIYLYGRADNVTTVGTLKWQGSARTDRSYQDGAWEWAASGLASRLEQSVGHDLEDPVSLSGIYLPASGGLALSLTRWDAAALGGSAAPVAADSVFVRMSGRWQTNDAFVAALNGAITSAVSGWGWGAGAQIQAESLGPTGWRLIYRTDGTTAHYVQVGGAGTSGLAPDRPDGMDTSDLVSPVDRLVTLVNGVGGWKDQTGAVVRTLVAGGLYGCEIAAPVPRGFIGTERAFVDPANPGNLGDRLYLGGTVGLSAEMWAVLRADGEEGDEEVFAAVDSVSASDRYIVAPGLGPAALGPRTRVRLARELADNQTVGGLITLLLASSANLVNSGAMPLISGADFDFDFGAIDEAASDLAMSRRTWISQEGITLREIIEHELRLLGCYLSVRQNGALTVRRLRAPTPTDFSSLTITGRNAVGGPPGLTFSPYGTIKQLLIRQGWSWTEGEHLGLTIKVTSAETADSSVLAADLEIAPRSRANVTGDFGLEVDIEQAYSLGSTTLGLFGGAYQVASFDVSFGKGEGTNALFDAELGETVIVTSRFLPSPDGTMGTTIRPGILTGYSWSPFEGRGSFEILFVGLNVGGYAPEFPISAETDNGTDEWALTLTTSGYVPTGTDATDWLTTGDEVQAILRGVAGSTTSALVDETGNAGDVAMGTAQAHTDGPAGYQGAVWFDGSDGARSSGVGTAAQWTALTSDCTLTAWVRLDSVDVAQKVCSFYGGSTDIEADNILADLAINAGGIPRLFFEHGAGTNVSLTGTTAVPVGAWTRLDWVRDSSAGTVESYVDGVLTDTFTSQPDATGGTTSRSIAIGEASDGASPLWGALYGLTLRDVAKSAAQIAAERTLPGPDGDTIGMWCRVGPTGVTGTVVSVTAAAAVVQFDAAVVLGTGSWLLAYQPSSTVDEAANGTKRWPQSDFAFVADSVRRLTFGAGDVDAKDFAP